MSTTDTEPLATVLIVDDAEVDRRLVSGLLGQDRRIRVRTAVNGRDALEKIEAEEPDLVVTDLMMPEMNGLELVAALKERHGSLPSILVTSRGSEELAVQALSAGAASYVPKRALGPRLLGTVHEVLAAARIRRGRSRLRGCMTRCDSRFVLENDIDLVRPLVTQLQGDSVNLGLCSEAEETRFGVALEEALTNAIFHGNLELDSSLREDDLEGFWRLAGARRDEEPYKSRHVHVDASLTGQRGVIEIRDEGAGFDPTTLPDPTDPENLHKVSGRGILLMRAFMDEVRFNDRGNAVTLVKWRS